MEDKDFIVVSLYDKNGDVIIMPAEAWHMGGDPHPYTLTIILNKITTNIKNIEAKNEFVLNIANDYHKLSTKNYTESMDEYTFEDLLNSGFTVKTGERVDAPIINEFPIRFECKLLKIKENETKYVIIGKIRRRSVNIVNI